MWSAFRRPQVCGRLVEVGREFFWTPPLRRFCVAGVAYPSGRQWQDRLESLRFLSGIVRSVRPPFSEKSGLWSA